MSFDHILFWLILCVKHRKKRTPTASPFLSKGGSERQNKIATQLPAWMHHWSLHNGLLSVSAAWLKSQCVQIKTVACVLMLAASNQVYLSAKGSRRISHQKSRARIYNYFRFRLRCLTREKVLEWKGTPRTCKTHIWDQAHWRLPHKDSCEWANTFSTFKKRKIINSLESPSPI